MNQASLEEKWRVIASYTTCNDFVIVRLKKWESCNKYRAVRGR